MSSESQSKVNEQAADLSKRQLQTDLSERTRGERDDLLDCMHQLEAAMGSPAPGREREWATRASSDLQRVRLSFERHILSAEGRSGLLNELEITTAGIPLRVANLRHEHQQILEQLKSLERGLNHGTANVDFGALREDAIQLLAAIRRHNANEVDLIFKCFWLDIGVGD
jgi:hypothetical protein